MDAWKVLGTVVVATGKVSGACLHMWGDGARINFNRSSHTHEEREEGYEKIAHIHEFADTVEDTICNFGEDIKMKSDD